MKNTISVIFQNKRDSTPNKQLRTLVLSTNVNDYDTGEPIVDRSIRKTLINSSQISDNPIHSMLNCIKVGRKYRNLQI
ncbi:MAG TPA: hypothetical protein VE573_14660 [Nitrososphaeraceae archaeon]|jgi:hypothetical protein|nr:hypothetical protein [Nitrososphaeraceae archaeon]